jgi:hypothetical protein
MIAQGVFQDINISFRIACNKQVVYINSDNNIFFSENRSIGI